MTIKSWHMHPKKNHTTCLKFHEAGKTILQVRKEYDNIESLIQSTTNQRCIAWLDELTNMKSHNAEETRNPKCKCYKNET